MIIKIQVSLISPKCKTSILIYGKGREHMYQTTDKEQVAEFTKLLKGQPKGYFHANKKREGFEVISEAKRQDW